MPGVLLVAPRDAVTAEIGERLAARAAAGPVQFLEQPVPAAHLADNAGDERASAMRYTLLAGYFEAVVYRPPQRGGAPDLADAAACLTACAEAGVPHVVLLSSAAVVAPRHDHPGLVAERPPARRAANRIARRWAELERLAEDRLGLVSRPGNSLPVSPALPAPGGVAPPRNTPRYSSSARLARSAEDSAVSTANFPHGTLRRQPPAPVRLTVLRPAPLAAREEGNLHAPLLAGHLALTVAGHDPMLQLLAPADLAEAVARALDREGPPVAVYHVAPAGAVPVRRALRHAGVRRLPLPYTLLSLLRPGEADRLAYLRYPATVSGERAERELGFSPLRTSAEAVRAGLNSRGRPGRSDGRAAREPLRLDDYGLDPAYVAAYGRTLFRFLHRRYWRIEVKGMERVPREGAAVLVGVHRGFMPWDGVMALHGLVEATGRAPRFLIHPTLVKFPFLANYMTKLGGVIACRENAERLLARGELLGVFPEGIAGAFSMYREAYTLRRFRRDEFARLAIARGAPIVPFVTVGSAEIYPILGKVEWRWLQRFTEWPFLPLTPTFPLLPFPLPSKWHTLFLPAIDVAARYPPAAAADPRAVRELSAAVRAQMERALCDLLRRRRSIFFGSIFAPAGSGTEPDGAGAEPGRRTA